MNLVIAVLRVPTRASKKLARLVITRTSAVRALARPVQLAVTAMELLCGLSSAPRATIVQHNQLNLNNALWASMVPHQVFEKKMVQMDAPVAFPDITVLRQV